MAKAKAKKAAGGGGKPWSKVRMRTGTTADTVWEAVPGGEKRAVSYARIAADAEVAPETVRRYLNDWELLGAVKRVPHPDAPEVQVWFRARRNRPAMLRADKRQEMKACQAERARVRK